ncbi:hypothetical protein [Isoptericola aurantiacus]|uniref:hypothetical protein n=1 Tax=Isoptericola aurantiacus TaxID=3377839 RepID=UPI00383BB5DE
MTDDLLAPLLAALPYGVPAGTDLRAVVVTDLLDWDEDSTRGLVEIDGGDGVWLLGLADAYWPDVVGNRVIVLRNAWTGKAAAIGGPVGHFPFPEDEPDVLPVRGTVTATATGRVTVSAGGQSYVARVVQSYTSPSSGDVVGLSWESDGSEVVATGRLASTTISAPSTPSAPSLSRSGSTLTVSWSKPGSVNTTRVRFRYGSSSWTVRKGLTGTSTTIPISEGRTREVQIAQSNAGGTSPWSSIADLTYPSGGAPPKPSQPKYETVTTTITPTSTGTYRTASTWNRWNGNRYGGFSTLYQGADYGSGTLIGLATYGSKIKDLRAVEIVKIEVRLVDANPGVYSPGQPVRVRATTHGSRPSGAPDASAGATETTSLAKGGSKWLTLGWSAGVLEQYRTGDLRGLILDGPPYRGLRGKGTSGFTIRVKYRRRV